MTRKDDLNTIRDNGQISGERAIATAIYLGLRCIAQAVVVAATALPSVDKLDNAP